MLVREIMTAPAVSVRPDSDMDEALRVMAERKVTAVPVVDDAGHVVGVLSEIDVLRRAVEPDTRAHKAHHDQVEPLPHNVGEIMTPNPTTTTEGSDVSDLVQLFTVSSYKSLPVVRGGRLVGVVSRSDVIRALWRQDGELLEDVMAAFHDYGQDHWNITVQHGCVEISGAGGALEREVAHAIARSVLGVRRVRVVGGTDEA